MILVEAEDHSRTGPSTSKIGTSLLLSLIFHAAVFGLLVKAPRLRPATEDRRAPVVLVTLAAGHQGEGEAQRKLQARPEGLEAAGGDREDSSEGKPIENAVVPRETGNPSVVFQKQEKLERPVAPASGKTGNRVKIGKPGPVERPSKDRRRFEALVAAQPENTVVKDRAGGPVEAVSADFTSGGGPDARPVMRAGAEGGSSGMAGSSSPSGGPVDVQLGAAGGPGFLKRVLPKYPLAARESGMEGTVVLRVTIDEHGLPVSVESLKRAGHGFDEEAMKAIRNSTFVAARINGRLTACKVIIPIRFELRTNEDD